MTTIAILGAKPSSTEATAKYGVESMRSHSTPRNIYNSLRKMFPGLGAIFTRMRVHSVYTYTTRPFPDPADNGQSMLSDIRGQMVVLLSRVSFFSPFLCLIGVGGTYIAYCLDLRIGKDDQRPIWKEKSYRRHVADEPR